MNFNWFHPYSLPLFFPLIFCLAVFLGTTFYKLRAKNFLSFMLQVPNHAIYHFYLFYIYFSVAIVTNVSVCVCMIVHTVQFSVSLNQYS